MRPRAGDGDPASCKHWLGATMEKSVDPGRGFIRLIGLARRCTGTDAWNLNPGGAAYGSAARVETADMLEVQVCPE
jgi:hypothetical protein